MLKFIIEFLKHPITVGAVAPSGRSLAKGITESIDFNKAEVIVEYGPGTGSFTRELIRRKKNSCKLILIEQNENFYNMIKNQYKGHENVQVIHGSAEDVVEILNKQNLTKVDYIVSGLPFTSLSEKVSKKIFINTNKVIGNKGTFLTFQYSLVKMEFFEKYFDIKRIHRVKKNLPPAYVLACVSPTDV